MQPTPERVRIALHAMLAGKMLYSNKILIGIQTDEAEGVLFLDPERGVYVSLRFQRHPQHPWVSRTHYEEPWDQSLLRELGAGGRYSQYQEIPLEHPEAQRVLKMYRAYQQINELRAECGEHLIDPRRPGNDQNPDPQQPGSTEPHVEFV